MTKTALDLSVEIDDLEALNKRLQDALKTIKDGSINVTIRVIDARKLITILDGQIKARCEILNNIKVNIDEKLIGEVE